MTDAVETKAAQDERIAALEKQLTETRGDLQRVLDYVIRVEIGAKLQAKRSGARLDEFFALMRDQKAWADAESELLENTRTELMKLTEVYYHVFPDRLPQDVRIIKQLDDVVDLTKRGKSGDGSA